MLAFVSPEIGDKAWVDAFLYPANNRACEYNFVNLLIWREKYHQKVARLCDTVVVQMRSSIGHSYLYPVGTGDRRCAIAQLEADARAHHEDLRFLCLSAAHVAELEGFFPGQFTIGTERDSFDYLYRIEDMAELTGKRYQAKRNHINHFCLEYPDWRSERITADTLPACLAMADDWYTLREGTGQDENLRDERVALHLAARHYAALGMDGVLLRAGGRLVAFSIGQRIAPDTFDVFFEKAYADVQGAYAMINRALARHVRETCAGVALINREDDMGLDALRKAKASYHPVRMEEKHYAIKRLGCAAQEAGDLR